MFTLFKVGVLSRVSLFSLAIIPIFDPKLHHSSTTSAFTTSQHLLYTAP